ncbi:hypothetical protein BC830DRAFT_1085804 [Chytriomyces sp. MP71]|nr:hypothetical protein BC830DRAFT_1085804 [Chytriomyces sp. MP71]
MSRRFDPCHKRSPNHSHLPTPSPCPSTKLSPTCLPGLLLAQTRETLQRQVMRAERAVAAAVSSGGAVRKKPLSAFVLFMQWSGGYTGGTDSFREGGARWNALIEEEKKRKYLADKQASREIGAHTSVKEVGASLKNVIKSIAVGRRGAILRHGPGKAQPGLHERSQEALARDRGEGGGGVCHCPHRKVVQELAIECVELFKTFVHGFKMEGRSAQSLMRRVEGVQRVGDNGDFAWHLLPCILIKFLLHVWASPPSSTRTWQRGPKPTIQGFPKRNWPGHRGVWSFSVATQRSFKGPGSDAWSSRTEWHQVMKNVGTQFKPQFANLVVQKESKVQIERYTSNYKSREGCVYASVVVGPIRVLSFLQIKEF